MSGDHLVRAMLGQDSNGFDYPEAWAAFWLRWRNAHSLLRCPGELQCPGGCGANAKDDLAAIQDARRGRPLTDEQRMRIKLLLRDFRQCKTRIVKKDRPCPYDYGGMEPCGAVGAEPCRTWRGDEILDGTRHPERDAKPEDLVPKKPRPIFPDERAPVEPFSGTDKARQAVEVILAAARKARERGDWEYAAFFMDGFERSSVETLSRRQVG